MPYSHTLKIIQLYSFDMCSLLDSKECKNTIGIFHIASVW